MMQIYRYFYCKVVTILIGRHKRKGSVGMQNANILESVKESTFSKGLRGDVEFIFSSVDQIIFFGNLLLFSDSYTLKNMIQMRR